MYISPMILGTVDTLPYDGDQLKQQFVEAAKPVKILDSPEATRCPADPDETPLPKNEPKTAPRIQGTTSTSSPPSMQCSTAGIPLLQPGDTMVGGNASSMGKRAAVYDLQDCVPQTCRVCMMLTHAWHAWYAC